MSDSNDAAPALQAQDDHAKAMEPHGKSTYKSWRKKYYKMRHQFHGLMGHNSQLVEDEQNTIKLARRLQEQNDQLLQLLYETNRLKKLPTNLRYKMDPGAHTPSLSDLPSLVDDEDDKDLFKPSAQAPQTLLALENVPHSSLGNLASDKRSTEEADRAIFDDDIGHLSPSHEAEYLSAIDALASRAQGSNYEIPNGPWSLPDSSLTSLRNPVSVTNWLRKHQPNDFAPDPEEKTPVNLGTGAREDKLPPRTAPTKVQPKRASVGAKPQTDHVEDEEIIGGGQSEHSAVGSLRGKRKQVDDEAYRPKGGNSRKRKKLSSSQNGAERPDLVTKEADGDTPT